MNQLEFYSEYVEPIKEGIKTSTIRKNFTANIGDTIEAVNSDLTGIPFTKNRIFGHLKITCIEYIRFDEINKEIAKTEGYLHENLLKETLYGIYDDDLVDSTLLYYIQFTLEDEENESAEN